MIWFVSQFLHACKIELTQRTSWRHGALYFSLALYKFLKHLRERSSMISHSVVRDSGNITPVLSLMLRDGVLFYAMWVPFKFPLCLFQTLNLITFRILSDIPLNAQIIVLLTNFVSFSRYSHYWGDLRDRIPYDVGSPVSFLIRILASYCLCSDSSVLHLRWLVAIYSVAVWVDYLASSAYLASHTSSQGSRLALTLHGNLHGPMGIYRQGTELWVDRINRTRVWKAARSDENIYSWLAFKLKQLSWVWKKEYVGSQVRKWSPIYIYTNGVYGCKLLQNRHWENAIWLKYAILTFHAICVKLIIYAKGPSSLTRCVVNFSFRATCSFPWSCEFRLSKIRAYKTIKTILSILSPNSSIVQDPLLSHLSIYPGEAPTWR